MGSRCYLIDVDNTLVPHGTEKFYPGALEKVNALFNEGHQIWLFTCRPPVGFWIQDFKNQGLKFHGVLPKPLADSYYYYDDRFKHGDNTFVPIPKIEGLPDWLS